MRYTSEVYFLVQKKPSDNYCYEFPNKWHFKNSGEKGRSREVLDVTTKGWKVKGTAIRDSYNSPEGLRTFVTAITTYTSK